MLPLRDIRLLSLPCRLEGGLPVLEYPDSALTALGANYSRYPRKCRSIEGLVRIRPVRTLQVKSRACRTLGGLVDSFGIDGLVRSATVFVHSLLIVF
jgi:hypothetical protein